MIPPRLEWLLPPPVLDPPAFTGFGRPVATLLARRGFSTQADLDAFLLAGRASLHPVSLMADADTALERLGLALDRGERIAIWGDYDADGMSAVAVWTIALRALGAEAVRHVPSRLADGYGLSRAGLDRLAGMGVSLVVTCDCGVVNVTEVAHARAIGLDLIVTDHHLPGPELPPAVAVVDPHRPDCAYPDPDLTGAGIAFKLAAELARRRGASVPDLAGVAAIGTVADMAPMTGESRAIVRLGLEELATTGRAGLRALLARACEHPEQPTARDLAYAVAPRVNAAGRIDEAELAISLLLEEEPEAAARLADALEEVHRRRRALTLSALSAAREMAASDDGRGPLLLRHDEWAPGIIGLVAGRLADDLARPVAVAVLVGEEVRGSVRAPEDFHVASALEACATFLTKRGGHAGAGGFSLLPAAWERFADAFRALPRPYPAGAPAAPREANRVIVDLVLPASHLGWSLAAELDRLAPYGPGHLEPIVAVTGLRVGDARRVGPDARHVALRLLRGAETVDAIAFATPAERPVPEEGVSLDVVGTLERDTFQGQPRLRLQVLDYATADASPLLARRRAARAAPTSQAVPLRVGEGLPAAS
ncbi:MAG TPA: single-stranded-DNA-specific exonuclease RecJ [candidate division Zixibacteria bacterium]|nr:single-stranded-DNA-specific exonuclease RecJ [candidate division Zixibacteria bacterium]